MQHNHHHLTLPLCIIIWLSHSVTYSYACRNIVNTIKTNRHTSLEKYTSHTLFEMLRKGYERVIVWGVSWRQQNCNILTPGSSGYSSTSFSSCGAAQPGALRALLSAGSGSHCFELQQLTPNSDLQLTSCRIQFISLFDNHLLPVASQFVLYSSRRQSRLSPDIFDRMHLLFTQVHFLFDSPAGSEVNKLHLHSSLSSIAFGPSSRQHPVSVQRCCR